MIQVQVAHSASPPAHWGHNRPPTGHSAGAWSTAAAAPRASGGRWRGPRAALRQRSKRKATPVGHSWEQAASDTGHQAFFATPGPPMPRCERRRCLERPCEMELVMKASHSLSKEPNGELPSGEELACRGQVGWAGGTPAGTRQCSSPTSSCAILHACRIQLLNCWRVAHQVLGNCPCHAQATQPPHCPAGTCECGSATAAAASADGLRRMRWPCAPYTVTAA